MAAHQCRISLVLEADDDEGPSCPLVDLDIVGGLAMEVPRCYISPRIASDPKFARPRGPSDMSDNAHGVHAALRAGWECCGDRAGDGNDGDG